MLNQMPIDTIHATALLSIVLMSTSALDVKKTGSIAHNGAIAIITFNFQSPNLLATIS